ncbi:MAG: DedA family protein [Candidatus Gracilibacteria bacterium]|nr:DedA family protein [Candidatus Gracilibacteria bacterium]
MISALIAWTKLTFLPYGAYGLFGLSFIESSFFPIPPDFLLIALALADPKKAIFFALICTIASVLGGLFGYLVGDYGGRPLLNKMFKESKINKVHKLFEKYEAWAIGIAALTPIPYKVFTIAAGVFRINLWRFTLASILGRGTRFFLVAILISLYGEPIVAFIDKYFELLTILGSLLIILAYLFYRFLKRQYKFVKKYE